MKKQVFAAAAFAASLAVPALAQHDHGGHAHETAFGRPADPRSAQRTITVEMRDSYEFSPAEIIAVNAGVDTHEMVLGTMEELKAHAEMMKRERGAMHHDHEPHIAHVAPGNSGVIAWQFTQAGEFYYGCLVDDHFEKGMVGKIRVTAAGGSHEHPM